MFSKRIKIRRMCRNILRYGKDKNFEKVKVMPDIVKKVTCGPGSPSAPLVPGSPGGPYKQKDDDNKPMSYLHP